MIELNRAIIEAAIVGFERRKQEIDETIAKLRAQLDGASSQTEHITNLGKVTKSKPVLNPAARKRIAAAQKARWAALHAKRAAPAQEAAPKKRKLSPEVRAKLAANLAKARAATARKKA